MTISLTPLDVEKDIKFGLMSQFCLQAKERLALKQKVPVRFTLQVSNFSLPKKPNTECIVIATGTGYAPFRAFAQERSHSISQKMDTTLGKMILFFGCRRREEDYIYCEEVFDHNSTGVYSAVFEAFSREDPRNKVYVQDILDHKADMINKLLYQQGGSVYICGSTAMSKDILRILARHVGEYKGLSNDQAEEEVDRLIREKQICMEAWN